MKSKQLNELRKKDIKEIRKSVDDLKIKLLKIKSEAKAGKEKNLKEVKFLRREIAQMLTVAKEKELMESKEINTNEQK